jgi:hypothetical protein
VELSKMISKNVMKTGEFEDSIFYRAACSCGANVHDVTIEFEKEEDSPMIFLNFYKKIAWCSHWGDHQKYRQRLWKRITGSLRMLFTGYVELEESFILTEENIEPFIRALIEGETYIIKQRQKIEKKKVG